MPLPDGRKLALVMVGLPARGKTYIARKLARYLSWLGHRTEVFNVGSYRRTLLGSGQSHEFFDPHNPEGHEARTHVALLALDDLLAFLAAGGEVGIYDATNTTRERRRLLLERCERAGHQVVFVESICDDESIIDANVRETKLLSPDYVAFAPDAAVRDFRARIAHYEQAYEPIDEDAQSYIKLIDVGRQVVVNRIQGWLVARLVFYLMNLHTVPRPIFLTRHGESEYNVQGRIGGDSDLTLRGDRYTQALAELVKTLPGPPAIWTSTLRRATSTARYLDASPQAWRQLDEIDAGVFDGWTYAEIKEKRPEEYAARAADKLRYRYPRGESYVDVIQRVEPVLIELERERSPVLVIAHQAVLRALYAYFLDEPQERCPHLSIPLHTLIELTPKAYVCQERRIPLGPATR